MRHEPPVRTPDRSLRPPVDGGGLLALTMALALTGLFWGTLWLGGGLVGGDVYSYSLPQKVVLADALSQGELPLWNALVGFGYPLLAESQTGVLYPLHLLLYTTLPIQTAWNFTLITHYVVAFLAAYWCARWMGLTVSGGLLAAVVYVYGWFPQRAFLDWAILGGVYLPLLVGCSEAYWQTGRRRYVLGLSLAVALQLLGGHYQIAFLSWLTLAIYGGGRLALAVMHSRSSQGTDDERRSLRRAGVWGLAFLLGVGLAAVQLLPTWELKGRSQRAQVGGEHNPAYGHIPPAYLSQIALPWVWYDPALDLDTALGKLTWGAAAAGTNRVEAHLYFGLLPLGCALLAIPGAWRRRRIDPRPMLWLLLAVLSVIYATGCLMPVLQMVPGFNFFRGPGRAGVVTTFAVALLAGGFWSTWMAGRPRRLVAMASTVLLGLTVADLWWLPSSVTYAFAVDHPPILNRDESPVRRQLLAEERPPRLYAPGANLPTLLGVSAVPVYLGIGPAVYFDPEWTLPAAEPDDFHTYTPERVAWLRTAGVTHILAFRPLEPLGWPVELQWAGMDPLLNPAWARFQEPIYLYRLQEAPGRWTWTPAAPDAAEPDIAIQTWTANERALEITTSAPGRLTFKELNDPGWRLTVDGVPSEMPAHAPIERAVEIASGTHRVVWSYRPSPVYWGGLISGLAAVFLGVGAWAMSCRPADVLPPR